LDENMYSEMGEYESCFWKILLPMVWSCYTEFFVGKQFDLQIAPFLNFLFIQVWKSNTAGPYKKLFIK